jgi:hypothetical protein
VKKIEGGVLYTEKNQYETGAAAGLRTCDNREAEGREGSARLNRPC